MNPDEFVFISLDVETNSRETDLAAYAEDNGFPWLFAVTTPEMMAALVQEFGPSISVPPSQPHFIISPDGTTTGLLTGNPPPEETIQMLQEAAGSA
ncbi:MAG TPA: hypothetical protein VER79_11880 [Candidatus Limnocylindrales bacterium]|nr:hypothetical protein [Candidatus Limnocylindrales bacterium]